MSGPSCVGNESRHDRLHVPYFESIQKYAHLELSHEYIDPRPRVLSPILKRSTSHRGGLSYVALLLTSD